MQRCATVGRQRWAASGGPPAVCRCCASSTAPRSEAKPLAKARVVSHEPIGGGVVRIATSAARAEAARRARTLIRPLNRSGPGRPLSPAVRCGLDRPGTASAGRTEAGRRKEILKSPPSFPLSMSCPSRNAGGGVCVGACLTAARGEVPPDDPDSSDPAGAVLTEHRLAGPAAPPPPPPQRPSRGPGAWRAETHREALEGHGRHRGARGPGESEIGRFQEAMGKSAFVVILNSDPFLGFELKLSQTTQSVGGVARGGQPGEPDRPLHEAPHPRTGVGYGPPALPRPPY